MWILFALGSAIIIGFYEVLKKHALTENAVIPVLYIATLCGSAVFLIANYPFSSPEIVALTPKGHLLLLLKALLVTSTWMLGFLGLKNLPISIAAPLGAIGPVFTLFGAIFILNERLTILQLSGCVIMIISFYLFSYSTRTEGISVFRNKWVFAMIGSSLFGAISSLYDKYLIPLYGPFKVQLWFSIYLPVIMTPFMFLLWYPSRKIDKYIWKWSIPLIGIFLILADYLYFHAINQKNALIAVIDALRRSNLLIAFFVGGILFGDLNIKKKATALFGILAGVLFIIFSK